MTSAGMTGRTRTTTALAGQAARRNRWPAGTLAAAGTIPEPPMTVTATLVISAGHHPANHRSAIPTRAYESGSGHGHDAAPAGHPHPQRSPPAPGAAPRTSCPDRPYHRLPPARVKGACGVAKTSAPRPFDPRRRSHDRGSYQGMGSDRHAPRSSHKPGHITPNQNNTSRNQAQELQRLDEALHMRSGAVVRLCRLGW